MIETRAARCTRDGRAPVRSSDRPPAAARRALALAAVLLVSVMMSGGDARAESRSGSTSSKVGQAASATPAKASQAASATPGKPSPDPQSPSTAIPVPPPPPAGHHPGLDTPDENQDEESGDSIEGETEFHTKTFVIPQGETTIGDRYFVGKAAQVSGLLEGDLLSVGKSTNVMGTITGDLTACSQYVDMVGEIGDDARILGQMLQVSGKVGGDLIAMGYMIDVLPGSTVKGKTLALGGEITLSGHFDQDVRAEGGQVVFGGLAEKNLIVESDVIHFESGAHVKGNLTYTARQEIESLQGPEAHKIVEGKVIFVPKATKKAAKSGLPFWEIWTFISAFIVGSLFIAIGRNVVKAIISAPVRDPLPSFGLGLLGHVCAPFAGLVLIVLCLTLPLGLLVLAVWGVLFYVAKLVVSASLGDLFLKWLGWTRSPYLALLIGMVPLWISFKIPILGLILYFLFVPIMGIGALIMGLRNYSLGSTEIPASPVVSVPPSLS